jgi:diguanylate cyclase (GGDEF)-like protein/PAS domain S-box-containing protein
MKTPSGQEAVPINHDGETRSISRQQFRKVQQKLLHGQIQNEFLIGLVVVITTCTLYWNSTPTFILINWSCIVLVTYAWRALFVSEKYTDIEHTKASMWGRQYLIAVILSGAAWGGLGMLAYYFGDGAVQLFTLFAIVTITLSAYTSMQSSPVTFAMFAFLSLTPITVVLVLDGHYTRIIYAIITALLTIVLLSSSRKMRNLLSHSILLSTHNKELIQKLVTARESTEVINEKLEKTNEKLHTEIEERRSAEEVIRESKERIQSIFEGMQDIIYKADMDGTIIWISPGVRTMLGYSAAEVVGNNIRMLYVEPEEFEKHNQAMDREFGHLQHYELKLRHRDGSDIWVSENAYYKYNELGIVGYEATLRDINELKHTQNALHMEQERAFVTLGSIGDGVIALTLQGKVEYMNIVAEQGTGWHLEEARGRDLDEIFKVVDEKDYKSVSSPMQLCLDEGKTIMLPGYMLLLHRHMNQRISIEVNASPIRDANGQITGVVLIYHDVSELRSLAKMTYQATHDALTDLINRREFEKRVHYAFESAREKDIRHALCYLDLDNFKVVNDTCGHTAGDELLKQLTSMLHSSLREGDTLARLGGDEFGILFSGCSIKSAVRLAEKIREQIDQFRFAWEGNSFRVGASIGLAPVTSDSGSMSEILSAADSACYVAKENGRNRVHVYELNDSELVEQQGQMRWVHRLQESLENNRFCLYFQPIVPIDEQKIPKEKLHGEILLRVREENGDLIGPGSFIPAAERYSLMPAIDRWVIENTLNTLAIEIDHVIENVSACSINLSGQSLSDERLMKFLIDLIEDTNVPPEILCFEITETAVISNLTNATSMIAKLREMGCHFALDDFGVGLSSFGYLKNLAVDYLKLDGCFIKNMTRDAIDLAMVQSINHIGQTMNIKTIAEFVENEDILLALRKLNVDYAQGYHIGKPEPLEIALYGNEQQPKIGSSIIQLKPAIQR